MIAHITESEACSYYCEKNPLPFPARDFSLYRLYHNQYPSNKPLLLCIVHIRVLAVLLDQLLMCTALYDLTVIYV